MMNLNPDMASEWKGRVLVQCIAEPTDKPIHKMESIDNEIVMEAAEHTGMKEMHIICEVGFGVALPSNNKYDIKVIVGGHEFKFEPVS